uniref:Uncharacterized protein n=1 Tax=Rhizophora mucronata TaxID=61149 RepID=A0A2P2Q0V8_RHIMU
MPEASNDVFLWPKNFRTLLLYGHGKTLSYNIITEL